MLKAESAKNDEITYVLSSEETKSEDRESQVDHVVEFASHLPSRNFARVSLRLEVIGSTMEPMSITINLKFIKVFELIEWMMLQIMTN